jgi:hypothetical protein
VLTEALAGLGIVDEDEDLDDDEDDFQKQDKPVKKSSGGDAMETLKRCNSMHPERLGSILM